MRSEITIISHLIGNETYNRKVLPFLEEDFFDDIGEKKVFNIIKNFVIKYSKPPTKEALLVELDIQEMSEETHKNAVSTMEVIETIKANSDLDWLVDMTEKWGKEKKIYNAMKFGVALMDDRKSNKAEILEKLRDALGYSFDSSVGHDYLADAEARYQYYHRRESKIPFDIGVLNDITDGGVSDGTLNILLAGTHVGKSALMASLAAGNLLDGKNVLYLTLEMSQFEMAKRIDAKLFDWDIRDIKKLPKPDWDRKVKYLREKIIGKLKIKEFPMYSASVMDFNRVMQDLQYKSEFSPDIIYVDQLPLMRSSLIKDAGNSYKYVGSISAELRGFSQLHKKPVITATQLNREGNKKSDATMTDIGESWGIAQNADLLLILSSNEALREANRIRVRQEKNRYEDLNDLPIFQMGVDYRKMNFYDVVDQDMISTPGEKYTPEVEPEETFDAKRFGKGVDFTKIFQEE